MKERAATPSLHLLHKPRAGSMYITILFTSRLVIQDSDLSSTVAIDSFQTDRQGGFFAEPRFSKLSRHLASRLYVAQTFSIFRPLGNELPSREPCLAGPLHLLALSAEAAEATAVLLALVLALVLILTSVGVVVVIVVVVAATVCHNELCAVVLRSTLSNGHDDWGVVGRRSHSAGTEVSGWQTTCNIGTQESLTVASVVDTLEEYELSRIRSLAGVEGVAQILHLLYFSTEQIKSSRVVPTVI